MQLDGRVCAIPNYSRRVGQTLTARLNGHGPYAYLRDILTRLPTQRASEIEELPPHKWVSA
ncbi:transposase domain-containing protein [Pseudomonas sp. Y39-6]|uniref:transposase domain-containing protein n=1 Tax=Pseudomonas sp. Y39-6 TaxID=2749807 RepID=UPI0025460C63|nr:transposase domain-containing protein [Pseudomonas sp. Y39-6]